MSFGSGGFGGGFGSGSNTTGGFGSGGGFGSTNNNSGFGSNNTTNNSNPFGQSNTGSSMFGGGNTNTNSPFGGGGGFGSSSNTTSFGSKPFGAGSTGGLFGGGGTSSGTTFGGFGATANNTSSTFGGGSSTGGGLFGQNKTGFGSSNTGGGMFGANTSGGFGTSNPGGFGSSTSGFGATGNQNQANNGTASTPFTAFQEKDSTGNQHYQTITFQNPYMGYSLEELRLADYNQGRRYGNQNGQAGAFGQSTGFGGFGNTNNTSTGFGGSTTGGSLFGNNNNSSTPFGQNNTQTSFGSQTNTTGGGLFGGNKTGGLFGNTNTSQPTTGGGLFGSPNTNTGNAFGSGGTSNAFGSSTSGGGLFGAQNNQAKPAFGGFGNSTNTNTSTGFGGTSTGFGATNNNTSGGNLFGQSNQTSSTPAFGANQQASTTGGGLFGNNTSSGGALFGNQNQNQNQTQQSGSLFGGGFGGQNNQQNQPKPGGLFGNTSTNTASGGLFGQNNQNQQSGGLFGNTNQNQNQGSSLFGNKPATTGGGLFGNTSQTNSGSTGGGLFGSLNTSTQQNTQGSSLFGNTQNQQKAGGLFGNAASSTNTGSGLFGGLGQNNTQPALGGSLFGSQNQQQQNQQPSNNSLFGASGSSLLQTSMNTNPYGNDALFANLQTPTQSPGPLATPLSSSQKNRRSAILPQHKLNPSASTRLLTPQNKRPGGYGFTYSTYGTPNSASSNASPNFTSSLYGNGSLGRSLGKSLSTSNLRNSFTPETSILAPGAFSTNGRSFATGSLKKLNINRNINTRPPLFDEPEKKRVSFAGPANGVVGGLTDGAETNGINGSNGGALVLRAEVNDTSVEGSSSRTSPTVNGDAPNGASGRPEMSQVNGHDLTSVPENVAITRASAPLSKQGSPSVDPTPGQYWSKPTIEELRKFSRSELTKVKDFVVGRQRIGEIQFNPGKTVDLSTTDLDKLFGDIVQLNPRNATVYGESCTVQKPAQGSGLNHPSRITLGNSWPRNKHGKRDQKHLERLKRVSGTTFEQYRQQTGEWVFSVPHFSSYGLDYEGPEYSDDDDQESSELSAPPDTPSQLRDSQMTGTPQEDSLVSTQSSPDDTFDFKKGKRKRASVPGGYGDQVAYEEEEMDDAMDTTGAESFLGERSVGSLDGQQHADFSEESESESVEDQDMAGSVSGPVQTTEPSAATSIIPRSILKNSQLLRPGHGTPSKGPLVFEDDWAEQLQRTISPKKQDRQALRESQGDVLQERSANVPNLKQSTNGNAVWGHVQMMESMFGTTNQGKGTTEKQVGHGIELPYSKRPKTSHDLDELSVDDRDFHSSNKPHFNENSTLVYASRGNNSLEGSLFPNVQEPIAGPDKDIYFTKLPTFSDASPPTMDTQKEFSKVDVVDDVPLARIRTEPASVDFADLANAVDISTPAGVHEHKAWRLLSLLFDENDQIPSDLNNELLQKHKEHYRKEKLSDFWQSLVAEDAERHVQKARTNEEKAIAYLSGFNIPDACYALVAGLDLRLATMVAQIRSGPGVREDVRSQIEEWERLNVISEMEEPIRAIHELLAGNCAKSNGKTLNGRENKASAFGIAEHFGLDWRRAFGLRLWYGTLADEPIELAVAQFADSIRDGLEDVKPIPWFIEHEVDMGWKDPRPNEREDILWGILKLYASSKMDLPTNVEDVLAPENVSGNPLNARLSFQIFQLLKSRQEDEFELLERQVALPTIRFDADEKHQSFMSSTTTRDDMDQQAENPLTELSDKLTVTYAASLHTPEHWLTALFVYSYLSSPIMREHLIRNLLEQFSHTYSINDNDPAYKHLVSSLHIPNHWIHAAAALRAKAEGYYNRQVVHLIKAGELEEAHEVLCHQVAPQCIISRDYDALREPLGDLNPTPPSSPTFATRHKRDPIPGWRKGGEIYYNYIDLIDMTSRQSRYRIDEELNEKIEELLSELQSALEIVARERLQSCELEERVALMEIAGHVAELIGKNGKNHAKVLKLPLTEDLWLKHSINLSTDYYRAIMTS